MSGFVTQVSHAGHYLHWGVISISVANALIVAVMVVVFVAAILLPLGRADRPSEPGSRP